MTDVIMSKGSKTEKEGWKPVMGVLEETFCRVTKTEIDAGPKKYTTSFVVTVKTCKDAESLVSNPKTKEAFKNALIAKVKGVKSTTVVLTKQNCRRLSDGTRSLADPSVKADLTFEMELGFSFDESQLPSKEELQTAVTEQLNKEGIKTPVTVTTAPTKIKEEETRKDPVADTAMGGKAPLVCMAVLLACNLVALHQ